MALRLGKPDPDALIVAPDGSPIGQPIEDWRRACRSLGLPMVMLHALRHTHATAGSPRGLTLCRFPAAWVMVLL